MVRKPLLQCLKRERLRAMHMTVLTVLISISIYSTYSVMNSFFTENKSTVSAVVTANNVLPFAKYLTLSLELRHASIFREMWHMKTSEYDQYFPTSGDPIALHFLKVLRRLYEDPELANSLLKSENLRLNQMVDIAALTQIISWLDDEFLFFVAHEQEFGETATADDITAILKNISSGLTAYSTRLEAMPAIVLRPEVVRQLDAFIDNPESDIIVDTVLSNIVKTDFIRLHADFLPNVTRIKPQFFLDGLTPTSIKITIPLDFLKDTRQHTLIFGVLPTADGDSSLRLSSVFYDYDRFTLDSSLGYMLQEDSEDSVVYIYTDLKNDGIYKSTAVRDVHECQSCDGLSTIDHCRFKCRVDFMIDQCRCIPFTFRRLYYSDSTRRGLSRCTIKRAVECVLALKQPSSAPCENERIVPCELHQNVLSVEARPYKTKADFVDANSISFGLHNSPFVAKDNNDSYGLYFLLNCPQPMYVLLEQQYQNTWMEMLGQVGGNLGIFLGFSLYGIWQVAVLGCTFYMKRKRNQSVQATDFSALGIVTPWLRLAQLRLSIDTSQQAVDADQDGISEIENRLAALEQRCKIKVLP